MRLTKLSRRILPALDRRPELVDASLLELFKDLAAERARWPLYLWGRPGTGKTRAALLFCDVAATASYATIDDLCNRAMRDPAESHSWFDWLQEKELGVLDELGVRQTVGDLHYATVKRFSDVREAKANRSIFVSNLPPADFQRVYDDRLASRLLSGTWFEVLGTDRRLSR